MAKILEKTQDISAHNTRSSTSTTNTTNNSIISKNTMDTHISENSINETQNTDQTLLEDDTLPYIKHSEKISLKRKNTNKADIEEEYSNSNEECPKKKKRFTPPYGKTRRIRWTEEERNLALYLFEKYIKSFTLPSFKEITSKTRNNILKHRQPATIKSWINNQICNAKRGK